MKSKIRIGTRKSPLAMWQANWVAQQLERSNQHCEVIAMDTRGDRMLNVPIPEIGSKGVFTEDLELELSKGNIDLAVHSAKDMPSQLPEGFELIAFTPREPAQDVLVSYQENLDLKDELVIGTSSTRRVALLNRYYPGFSTESVRGNLQTRLRKLKEGNMSALALAYAGISRLGLNKLICHSFPLDKFVPAVGQGSMAVEVSSNLQTEKKMLLKEIINHPATEICVRAERAFLFTIQGGCSIPAFAHARLMGDKISMTGGIVSLDGKKLIQLEQSDRQDSALGLGQALGKAVLDAGGNRILDGIKFQINQKNENQK